MSSKKKAQDKGCTFIYELPYSITREICQNLDVDRAWERLASEIGYTNHEVSIFELALSKVNDSPTKQILTDWGARNPTARDLYNVLQKINRRRETQLLDAWFKAERSQGVPFSGTSSHTGASAAPPGTSSSGTPSMILRVLEDAPLPKPPGKGSKSSKQSTGYSTSSMNNSAMSANGNINLNKPDDPKGSHSKKHFEGKDFKSFDKDYQDKFLPVKGDYLNKMKETIGVSSQGVDKMGENHCSMSSPSIHEDHCETDGPAESKGNLAAEKIVDSSWMETLKSQDGYNTLAKDGMCELEIALALIGTQSFTYKELNQATNGFSDEYKIGEGAFGEVYKGLLKNTKCAIKKLYPKQECNDESHNVHGHLKSELKALIRYRHENIVPLYGYTLDGNEICLVYQYMQNGSLEDKLKMKDVTKPLTWEQRLSIMRGAACGLQYLHTLDAKPLIHGDMKSANILLDKHLEAKIGDLGLAQHATGGSGGTRKLTHITKKQAHSKQYQCMAYLPPEAQRGTQMSIKGDTYSFGVVMMEIFTGEMAYDERREGGKFLSQNLDDIVGDNLERCLSVVDSGAGPCSEKILMDFYSIAYQCTKDKKKDRPEMVLVYTQLEHLEELQASSDTNKLCDVKKSEDGTIMDKMSFESYGQYTPGVMAANPPSTADAGQMISPCPGAPQTLQSHPQECLGAPQILQSLPQGCPIPEALQMQMMYDKRKLSTEERDFPSDPQKMLELMKFDQQENQSIDPVLPSDPEKEKALSDFDHHYVNTGAISKFKRSNSVERVIDELDKVKLELESASQSRKNSYASPCSSRKNSSRDPEMVFPEIVKERLQTCQPYVAEKQTEYTDDIEKKESIIDTQGKATISEKPNWGNFFAKYEQCMKEEMNGEDGAIYDEEYEGEEYEGEDYGCEDYEEGEYYEEDEESTLTESAFDTAVLPLSSTDAVQVQDKMTFSVTTGNEVSNKPCPIETSESLEGDCVLDKMDEEDTLFGDSSGRGGSDSQGGRVTDTSFNTHSGKDPVILEQLQYWKEKRTVEPSEGECFV